MRQIAEAVGVSEKAIRKQLRRLGWPAANPAQAELPLSAPAADPNLSGSVAVAEAPAGTVAPAADPNLSGSAATAEQEPEQLVSADRDPADRRVDRLLAKLGLLEDAAPLFRDGERVPRAGVLLALPALAQSGVARAPGGGGARCALGVAPSRVISVSRGRRLVVRDESPLPGPRTLAATAPRLRVQ